MAAVAKLHGVMVDSSGRQADKQSKKRRKSDGVGRGAVRLWARQVSGEGAHVKKWRLIIRNLPFQVVVGVGMT